MTNKKVELHLCWDCRKAEDRSCLVYNQLEAIVDENFTSIEIRFQVPSCEFFEEEEFLKKPGKVVRRDTNL